MKTPRLPRRLNPAILVACILLALVAANMLGASLAQEPAAPAASTGMGIPF